MRRFGAAACLVAAPVICPAQDEAPGMLSFEVGADTLSVDPGDVETASAGQGYNNEPAILLQLAEGPANAFGLLTKRNVGNHLSVRLCGQEISNPRIQTPIEGGSMFLLLSDVDLVEPTLGVLLGRSTCDALP